MNEQEILARTFEANRARLRGVAYRMLGSLAEAEDAVQEAWLRLSRSEGDGIDNLDGWLTTVVARICLDMLRSRKLDQERLPDPIVTRQMPAADKDLLLSESIGLALLVVLETLEPAERIAFILHDVFAMPFDDIALVLDKSPAAARQLASRGRRRVQGARVENTNVAQHRELVEAFIAAAQNGDVNGLVAVLHPDAILRADRAGITTVRGAEQIARQAAAFSQGGVIRERAFVNGAPGVLAKRFDGRLISVMSFTVSAGKIVEIDILADPERLQRLAIE
jgi:RNA polymerase sigma factor (sigma-70 family)